MAKAPSGDPNELVRVVLKEPHILPAGGRLPVEKPIRVSASLRDELRDLGKLAE